jgi:GWxTD domain-containing protein
MRTLVRGAVLVLLSLFSLSMYAALSQKYVDFGKSPARWLMTRDEQKKWKSVSTDEQAQEFIDLFWAHRDPTPGTYVNEYKQEYDARVKYAAENYGHRQVKGEQSDRGHAVIVLGFPSNNAIAFKQKGATNAAPNDFFGNGGGGPSGGGPGYASGSMMGGRDVWLWEKEDAKKYDMPKIEAVFIKDPINGLVQRDTQRNDILTAFSNAIDKAIVSKDMTVAPEWAKRPPTQIEFVAANKDAGKPALVTRHGEPGVHTLLLVKDAMALPAPQSGTDPFAGAKAISTFSAGDDLGYAFEYCGPAETLKMTISIRGSANGQKVNMVAPLEDVPVEAIKVVPGCSLVRASIPLSDMKVAAGTYAFSIKLDDGSQSYDLAQDFKVE